MEASDRRTFFSLLGAGVLLGACRKDDPGVTHTTSAVEEQEVGAVEDLMREHGVIRRVLVVYRECALRLHTATARPIATDPLHRAAQLMRSFGQDYHERQLEEARIFPVLHTPYVDQLRAQHQRGRELTDYILAATSKPISDGAALARALDDFARMYEGHAAFEDTVVFPAWKKTMSRRQLDEVGEQFEEIEHKVFGKDGFDDGVQKLDAIEKALGIELTTVLPPVP